MTEWEWQVIIALCKLVMKLVFHTRISYSDIEPEMRIVEEAIHREKHK